MRRSESPVLTHDRYEFSVLFAVPRAVAARCEVVPMDKRLANFYNHTHRQLNVPIRRIK